MAVHKIVWVCIVKRQKNHDSNIGHKIDDIYNILGGLLNKLKHEEKDFKVRMFGYACVLFQQNKK